EVERRHHQHDGPEHGPRHRRASCHQGLTSRCWYRRAWCFCRPGGATSLNSLAKEKPPIRLITMIAISAARRKNARRKLRRGSSAQKLFSGGGARGGSRSCSLSGVAKGARSLSEGPTADESKRTLQSAAAFKTARR